MFNKPLLIVLQASLKGADLFDRRLHVVPTADELSTLRAGLLSFASSPQEGYSHSQVYLLCKILGLC